MDPTPPQVRQGGEEVGASFRRDLKLISEVQAPFRGVRRFIYLGLMAAAGIATVFTVPQFVAALGGGEQAPDLGPTAVNLATNVGGRLTKAPSLTREESASLHY